MQCQKCGAENDEGCRFCTSCGALLEAGAAEAGTTVAPAEGAGGPAKPDQSESRPPQSGPNYPLIIGVACALVVVAVAIVLLLPRFASSDADSEAQTPKTEEARADGKDEAVAAKLSFSAGESGEGSMDALEVGPDGSVVLPECAFTREGHSFAGWKDEDGNVLQPGASMDVDKDTGLVATWKANEVTIKFLGAGADSGSMTPLSVSYGSEVTLPVSEFTRSGYEFDCWVDEDGATYRPGESTQAVADTVMTVRWKALEKAEDTAAPARPAPQETTPVTNLSASTLPRRWEGSYEGYTTHTADGVISRAVTINLTSVSSDGTLKGVVYVGEREMIEGATWGSYNAEGTIDWQSGYIHLWGTTWVDQGGLIGVGGFTGYVDLGSKSIAGQWYDPDGEAEPGNWYVRAV